MGDVVNLRRFRKAQARALDAEQAARNRASFGRTRAERAAATDETARGRARLDARRLDSPDGTPVG